MKKLVIMAALLLIAVNSFAFVGFGGHFGYDLLDISKEESTFTIPVGQDGFKYSVARDAITNPMCAGVQLYFDLPIMPIGFEAGYSAAWAKYNWTAPNKMVTPTPEQTINISIPGYQANSNGDYSEEFNYVRMTADITAKYYFLGLPPVVKIVDFYIGGGIGMYFITPLVSQELFVNELQKLPSGSTTANVDVEELVKENTVFGGHFVAGAKIKPPVIPLSINIDYKYNFTPENDYKDKTNKFSTIKASLNFYI